MRYFSYKLQSKTLKFSMHWINREERKVTTILQISLSGVLKSHLCLYFKYSSPERLVILPTNEKPGHYQWQNSQKSDGLSAIVSTNRSPSPGKETKQEWRCCATPEPELQFQRHFRTALEAKLHHLVSAQPMHTVHPSPQSKQCKGDFWWKICGR